MHSFKPIADAAFLNDVPAPFKQETWLKLTPGERMRRSLRMRRLIPNIKELHDRKLFPKPEGI
jgi:hypothetical protein